MSGTELLDQPGGQGREAPTAVTHQDQFICRDCLTHFYDLWKFLEHKSSHNPKPGCFQCYICKSLLKTQAALKTHYKDYHRFGYIQGRRSNPRVRKSRNAVRGRLPVQEKKLQSSKVLEVSIPKFDNYTLRSVQRKKLAAMESPQENHRNQPNSSGGSKRELVGVARFDGDFLFHFGMKENMGKSMKYMKEVFICLHCTNLERGDLNSLVAHMRGCHSREIVDLCSPQDISGTPVKALPGTSLAVTSFKEYRAKCLPQKTL